MSVVQWPVIVAVFVVVLPAQAMAGPINWSYATSGARTGVLDRCGRILVSHSPWPN